MLNWLSGLIGRFTGILTGIWNDVISVVTSVYHWALSYLETIYHDLIVTIDALNRVSESIGHFIDSTYDTFVRYVLSYFDRIISWTREIVSDVEKYAENVYHAAFQGLDNLEHWAESEFNDFRHWILTEIWNPLYNDITGAIRWIEHEGAFAYDLLTHPDKLATLLIGYVWNGWLGLARKYAKPLLSMFLSEWRSATPDIVSILEDLISSLL